VFLQNQLRLSDAFLKGPTWQMLDTMIAFLFRAAFYTLVMRSMVVATIEILQRDPERYLKIEVFDSEADPAAGDAETT